MAKSKQMEEKLAAKIVKDDEFAAQTTNLKFYCKNLIKLPKNTKQGNINEKQIKQINFYCIQLIYTPF